MNYRIVGFDFDSYEEPVAVATEQWYNRSDRLWTTIYVDANGHQVGDAEFDGRKVDAIQSRRLMDAKLKEPK